ncbi:MAG: hypothetical protein ABIR54_12175 [Burkholderiaceae bacterium]
MALPRPLQLRRHFQRVVLARPWLTFVVMGIAFFCFGIVSLNLLHLLRANADLILDNGVMALADGGAAQLVQLIVNGYFAMLAYVVMKTCGHTLSHWLADTSAFAPSTVDDERASSDSKTKH